MVSEDDLQALDYLIWFGAGRQAAEQGGTTQSTISRRASAVLSTFQLSLQRGNGGYQIKGRNRDLLTMQRRVHQGRRLLGRGRRRLDAAALIQPLLERLDQPDWVQGPCEQGDAEAMAALLRDHCLDAWLGPVPPNWSGSSAGMARDDLAMIPLLRAPWRLCCRCRHPLATRRDLRIDDLTPFPLLRLHPCSASPSDTPGPGDSCPTGAPARQKASARAPFALNTVKQLPDEALILAPSLSLLAFEDLTPLQLEPGQTLELEPGQTLGPGTLIGLLLLEDHVSHPSMLNLIERLGDQVRCLQAEHPNLEISLVSPQA